MHTEGDADLCIIQTAIEAASQGSTSLIREDTDILVLQYFHADVNLHPPYFRSEEKQTCKKTGRGMFMTQVHTCPKTCHLLPFMYSMPFLAAIPLYDCMV